jgi:hypothetical protein
MRGTRLIAQSRRDLLLSRRTAPDSHELPALQRHGLGARAIEWLGFAKHGSIRIPSQRAAGTRRSSMHSRPEITDMVWGRGRADRITLPFSNSLQRPDVATGAIFTESRTHVPRDGVEVVRGGLEDEHVAASAAWKCTVGCGRVH